MNVFSDDPDDEVSGIVRDRNGRPYILMNPDWPEAEGFKKRKAEPRGLSKTYTRVTTFVGALEDTYNLGLWQLRMAVIGMASRPGLIDRARAVPVPLPGAQIPEHEEKEIRNALQEIAEEALEAADWKGAASRGTAFHKVAEYADLHSGYPPRFISPETLESLIAYLSVTDGWKYDPYFGIEHFLVNDELECAGTADRLRVLDSGILRVADIKTGSVEYGQGKMALQLAAYATSRAYDTETGVRTELDVDLSCAEIVHVPIGQGSATIFKVDIRDAVSEVLALCTRVRAWRARKDLFSVVETAGSTVGTTNAVFSPTAAAWPKEAPRSI